MKIKIPVLLALFFLTLSESVYGKFVEINPHGRTEVKEGESIRIISVVGITSERGGLVFYHDDLSSGIQILNASRSVYRLSDLVFDGPCSFQGSDGTALAEILPKGSFDKYFPGGGGNSGAMGGTAQYATVIPENLTSNVKLRLQQSTDLINWTDVQPGEFTPSAQKRFFRVNSEVIRTVAITGATSANPIVITAPAHGFSTGNQVQVSGVQGNVSANGTFTITVVDANTFSLNGADGSAAAAYTSGGTVKKP